MRIDLKCNGSAFWRTFWHIEPEEAIVEGAGAAADGATTGTATGRKGSPPLQVRILLLSICHQKWNPQSVNQTDK